jgi:DNA-binding NtrC family response regulator
MSRVLVVDDDPGILESAALALEKVGHRVFRAASASDARDVLDEQRIDVVVSDIYMPGEDGLALLGSITQRIGAFDYLAKPFDVAELLERVRAATTEVEVVEEKIAPGPDTMIVGAHPSMVAMYKAITRIASIDVPVLILGESGSGKELVARAIHTFGARADGPFVPIHCGAIPDTLLENELFGSIRGAYTDSRHDRRGALSRGDGGMVFLDEIGDISPAFQVKLLRFLQDGLVTPLGSDKSHAVNVRVVAATHRDLKSLAAAGAFRQDLFFRLAGYEIRVPPLRERTSDIPLLVEHFRQRLLTQVGRPSIAGPTREVCWTCSARTRGRAMCASSNRSCGGR